MRELPLRSSFQKKLLTSFLAVGIVPLVLCAALILGIFQATLARSAQENAESQMGAMSSGFSELLDACRDVLDALAEEPLVAGALTGAEGSRGTQVYNALYAAASPLLREADFSLYDAGGRLLYSTVNGAAGSLPVNWGALAAARGEGGTVCRAAAGDGLRMAEAVARDGQVAGYAVAEVAEPHFRRLLEGKYGAECDVVVLDPFWDQVYASPTLQDDGLSARLRGCLLAGRSFSEAGEGYTYHVWRDDGSGFFLLLRQPKPLAEWMMRLFYLVTGVAIALCVLLCIQVAMGFSRQLFEPIRALHSAMAAVEGGDLDARVEVTGADEISQLSGRFNRMTDQLKTNLADSIRQQQELGDAQIRMMQAQLNPHFLYNTLDTLKWLGKIHNVPEIATISADLADILRCSISAGEFTPLREELRLLERYVEIQELRFPDKFRYAVAVEPELLDLQVPKLMLQPLVENAIIHGFEDGGSGHITVTGVRRGDTALLTVQDDGCGMSPESLARFEARERPGGKHLGLYNVDAILRLHYGEEHGLRFLPAPGGRGTCVQAGIPLEKKEG